MKLRLFIRTLWHMNRALPVLLVALLLGSVAAYVVNTWVLDPKLRKLQRTYIAQREQMRGGESARGTSAATRLERGREDLASFREVAGDYGEFPRFIGELFDLSDKAGLTIERVRYTPEGLEEVNLLRYDLSFSVTGEYGEIKRFIFSLEQSDRIIVIEEIALAGGSAARRGSVTLQISLSTYFARDTS